jgi:hypothetical protein
MRSIQMHLRHYTLILTTLRGLHGLLPSRSAETPFAARCEADGTEIIATGSSEIEEGVCEGCFLFSVSFLVIMHEMGDGEVPATE